MEEKEESRETSENTSSGTKQPAVEASAKTQDQLVLRKKRRVRGGHRGSCTRCMGEFQHVVDEARYLNVLADDVRASVRHARNLLACKRELLAALDAEVLDLVCDVSDGDVEEEVMEADDWTLKLQTFCSTLDRILDFPAEEKARTRDDRHASTLRTLGESSESTADSGKAVNPITEDAVSDNTSTEKLAALTEESVVASSASSSQLSTLSSVSASGSSARVKLPKLELGKFGGNAMEWQHFFDVFKSLIHSNSGLTDTDKFTYLRSSVYGAAAAVISGLSLTEANYAAEVKCLEQRYGDPQRIISAHMDAVLNLPGISNEHDLSGLRKLLDSVVLLHHYALYLFQLALQHTRTCTEPQLSTRNQES